MSFAEFRKVAHGEKKNCFHYHSFLQMKGALFFLRSLKLPSIQFQQNGHLTEEDEYVKEHSLVRFPQYHWNAKQAEVLNFRPGKVWSCDSYSIACRCLQFCILVLMISPPRSPQVLVKGTTSGPRLSSYPTRLSNRLSILHTCLPIDLSLTI